MHCVAPGTPLCMSLLVLIGGIDVAGATPLAEQSTPKTANSPTAASPAPASPAPTPAVVPAAGGDAAAKHAKRTECLRQARERKLVGPQKNDFIKECLAAP